MSENEKSMWKGNIIFGLVNLGFVWLCTKISVMLLSSALILMIACGIYVSFQEVKEDWACGRKGASFLCAIGLLINLAALVYYVIAILGNLLMRLFLIFAYSFSS